MSTAAEVPMLAVSVGDASEAGSASASASAGGTRAGVNRELLPPIVPVPPKLTKFANPNHPFYFIRVVEKRSSKAAWQKRVLILTETRLMLAELQSMKIKRWPRLGAIDPLIKRQATDRPKEGRLLQYLIRVPSEEVDMLIVFSGDERNDRPDEMTPRCFERTLAAVMHARGLPVTFETADDYSRIEEGAKLEKTADFRHRRDAVRTASERARSQSPPVSPRGGLGSPASFFDRTSSLRTPSKSPTVDETDASAEEPAAQHQGGRGRDRAVPPPLNFSSSAVEVDGDGDGDDGGFCASPTRKAGGGALVSPGGSSVARGDASLLPLAVEVPSNLKAFKDPRHPFYFIRVVEKRTAKGTWQKRVLILTQSRLVLAEMGLKIKRWPRMQHLDPTIRTQATQRRGGDNRQYLIAVPEEGVDMLLVFSNDDKNPRAVADLEAAAQFEEVLASVCRYNGHEVVFQPCDDDEPLENAAQLNKPQEFLAVKENRAKEVRKYASERDREEKEKKERERMTNRQDSAASDMSTSPSTWLQRSASWMRGGPGKGSPRNSSASPPTSRRGSLNPDAVDNVLPPVPRGRRGSVGGADDMSCVSAMSIGPVAPINEALLPPPAVPPPKLGRYQTKTSPKFYFIRHVEKRSAKGALQKRVLILTSSRLVLAEESMKMKRWPRVEHVKSPIKKQNITRKGLPSVQYLIQIPAEGVDMLVVFSEDDRNNGGTPEPTVEAFEEAVHAVWAAKALEMEIVEVDETAASLEEEAVLDKPKDFVKTFDKKTAARSRSQGSQPGSPGLAWNYSFSSIRNRSGSPRAGSQSPSRAASMAESLDVAAGDVHGHAREEQTIDIGRIDLGDDSTHPVLQTVSTTAGMGGGSTPAGSGSMSSVGRKAMLKREASAPPLPPTAPPSAGGAGGGDVADDTPQSPPLSPHRMQKVDESVANTQVGPSQLRSLKSIGYPPVDVQDLQKDCSDSARPARAALQAALHALPHAEDIRFVRCVLRVQQRKTLTLSEPSVVASSKRVVVITTKMFILFDMRGRPMTYLPLRDLVSIVYTSEHLTPPEPGMFQYHMAFRTKAATAKGRGGDFTHTAPVAGDPAGASDDECELRLLLRSTTDAQNAAGVGAAVTSRPLTQKPGDHFVEAMRTLRAVLGLKLDIREGFALPHSSTAMHAPDGAGAADDEEGDCRGDEEVPLMKTTTSVEEDAMRSAVAVCAEAEAAIEDAAGALAGKRPPPLQPVDPTEGGGAGAVGAPPPAAAAAASPGDAAVKTRSGGAVSTPCEVSPGDVGIRLGTTPSELLREFNISNLTELDNRPGGVANTPETFPAAPPVQPRAPLTLAPHPTTAGASDMSIHTHAPQPTSPMRLERDTEGRLQLVHNPTPPPPVAGQQQLEQQCAALRAALDEEREKTTEMQQLLDRLHDENVRLSAEAKTPEEPALEISPYNGNPEMMALCKDVGVENIDELKALAGLGIRHPDDLVDVTPAELRTCIPAPLVRRLLRIAGFKEGATADECCVRADVAAATPERDVVALNAEAAEAMAMLEAQLHAATVKMAALEDLASTAEVEKAALETQVAAVSAELLDVGGQLAAADAAADDVRGENRGLRAEVESLLRCVNELTAERDAAVAQLRAVQPADTTAAAPALERRCAELEEENAALTAEVEAMHARVRELMAAQQAAARAAAAAAAQDSQGAASPGRPAQQLRDEIAAIQAQVRELTHVRDALQNATPTGSPCRSPGRSPGAVQALPQQQQFAEPLPVPPPAVPAPSPTSPAPEVAADVPPPQRAPPPSPDPALVARVRDAEDRAAALRRKVDTYKRRDAENADARRELKKRYDLVKEKMRLGQEENLSLRETILIVKEQVRVLKVKVEQHERSGPRDPSPSAGRAGEPTLTPLSPSQPSQPPSQHVASVRSVSPLPHSPWSAGGGVVAPTSHPQPPQPSPTQPPQYRAASMSPYSPWGGGSATTVVGNTNGTPAATPTAPAVEIRSPPSAVSAAAASAAADVPVVASPAVPSRAAPLPRARAPPVDPPPTTPTPLPTYQAAVKTTTTTARPVVDTNGHASAPPSVAPERATPTAPVMQKVASSSGASSVGGDAPGTLPRLYSHGSGVGGGVVGARRAPGGEATTPVEESTRSRSPMTRKQSNLSKLAEEVGGSPLSATLDTSRGDGGPRHGGSLAVLEQMLGEEGAVAPLRAPALGHPQGEVDEAAVLEELAALQQQQQLAAAPRRTAGGREQSCDPIRSGDITPVLPTPDSSVMSESDLRSDDDEPRERAIPRINSTGSAGRPPLPYY